MENYIFLFSPGNSSYIEQLAKYCPDVKINDTQIINKKCQPIITSNYECVKYAEIVTDLNNKFSKVSAGLFCNVKNYFTNTVFADNTGSENALYLIDPTKYNLGQDLDLEQINKVYQKIISNNKDAKIICFGVSRGGAAVINFVAKYKPTNIKGIILEGSPSSLMEIVNNSYGVVYLYYNLVRKLVPYITSYKFDGDHPIDNVTKLPHDIPILFITSKNDIVVPYNCSMNMHKKMIENGYQNVDILILEKSGHNDYLSNNEIDTNKYLEKVSEFYSKIKNEFIYNNYI